MKHVYLFLADGFETIEALTVVDVLRRAKMPITTVSITEDKRVVSAQKIAVEADAVFGGCDFSDADMFVLPGGIPGTPNLEAHMGLSNLIDEVAERGGKLAAICAAPSILGKKGLLKEKKATAYPGFEESLIGALVQEQAVVVDGNIITARGMGTSIDFALAILQELGFEEEAKQIGEGIQFSQYYTLIQK